MSPGRNSEGRRSLGIDASGGKDTRNSITFRKRWSSLDRSGGKGKTNIFKQRHSSLFESNKKNEEGYSRKPNRRNHQNSEILERLKESESSRVSEVGDDSQKLDTYINLGIVKKPERTTMS